jgi:hypothetical protein
MVSPDIMRGLLAVSALLLVPALARPGAAQTGTASSTDPLGELERLQARIEALEVRIVDTAGDVELLKETALTGDIGRTYGDITHRDELGSGYRLQSVRYVMDGRVLFERTAEQAKELQGLKVMPLYRGPISPGDHLIEVEAVVRSGTFGIFTYAEGYRFKVASKYTLRVREGRLNQLSVVFHQKPDVTLAAEDRLGVRYDLAVEAGAPVDESSAVER